MRFKSPARSRPLLACAAAVAAACAGCADLTRASRLEPAGVNVESPAAGIVLAAESRTPPYPSFRDVPARPADIEKPAQVAKSIGALNAQRAAFRAWEADNPLAVSDTRDFAETNRNGVQAQSPAAPPTDQTQRSAEWAKRVRDAAKAPSAPPPKP